jgi:signal transduction histidine kinase/CheY-like chemotaxis protein
VQDTVAAPLPDAAALTDLRVSALRALALAAGCLGFLIVVATGAFIGRLTQEIALIGFGLAGVGVLTLATAPARPLAGAVLLIVGLFAAVAGGLLLFPSATTLAWAAVAAAPAATLVGRRVGLALLAVGCGATTLLAHGLGLGATTAALLGAALPLAVFAVVSVLWRAIDTALGWAWSSYEEVQRRTAQLRERQAELLRVNRSIEHSYQRLEELTGQLERARRAAEEARRLKAEFAASVSHELRTPVSLIVGLSELMVMPERGAPPLPSRYRAEVEAIYRNASHISNLVDDVLDLSQLEAHSLALVREWTSLADVVVEATSAVETLFRRTGVRLDVRLPADLPQLFIDPLRVRQILINLLNNAVRFTEVGEVTVSARLEQDQVVVEVADTGVGIDPADLPSVFRDFWRPGEPVRGRRGSGLGLAVSKRFAELHGGNMWVTSVRGRGSAFALALPIGERAIVSAVDLADPAWARIEERTDDRPVIAFVDADPAALRALRRHLEHFAITAVPSVRAAAALAGRSPLRAAIVRGEAQRAALERALRDTAPTLPIFACAFRTPRTIAQELGVSDYLTKPVSQAQLARTLRHLGADLRDVVVADDDQDLLRLLCRMVERRLPSCRVRPAANGLEALDLVGAERPDALLLDLRMPLLDGHGVIAALRSDARLASVPVVVLTARGAGDDGIAAPRIELSRAQGFSVAELARWVRLAVEGTLPSAERGVRPAAAGSPG